MNIQIPKCYLNMPERTDNLKVLTYTPKKNSGSLYASEIIGYKPSYSSQSPIIEPITPLIENQLTFDYAGVNCTVNSRLSDIVEEILDSENILSLKGGWGDNGKEITKNTYISAINALILYSEYILENYNFIIQTPEINPVRNGSIDIVWNTEKGYLIFNINEDLLGTFFGFKKLNPKFKEGEVDLINVEPSMALFMKDLI